MHGNQKRTFMSLFYQTGEPELIILQAQPSCVVSSLLCDKRNEKVVKFLKVPISFDLVDAAQQLHMQQLYISHLTIQQTCCLLLTKRSELNSFLLEPLKMCCIQG